MEISKYWYFEITPKRNTWMIFIFFIQITYFTWSIEERRTAWNHPSYLNERGRSRISVDGARALHQIKIHYVNWRGVGRSVGAEEKNRKKTLPLAINLVESRAQDAKDWWLARRGDEGFFSSLDPFRNSDEKYNKKDK